MKRENTTQSTRFRVQVDDDLSQIETYAPKLLQAFLRDLNHAPDRHAVWALLEQLCSDLGQRYVLYGFGYKRSETAADYHSQSNLPKEWKGWIDTLPRLAEIDYGRRHAITKLTAFAVGVEFIELYRRAGLLDPKYEEIIRRASEIGWRSGLFIPLRSTLREERGGFTIGGDLSEPEFRDFIKEHGWTISMAGVQSHNIYLSMLLREEAERFDLTSRQLEFLKLSASGFEVKEIAFSWGVSVQYVTRIRRELCERFGVTSKMAVMAKAVRLDLLTEKDFEVSQAMSTSWS
ncbi:autoinducer binding domain-containing protein [Marinovum sp.]|uniref:autoinducer binding domain-containing protein n=1 Tax=Marinovum sp. TaxID=2024839 RepID=UPI002B278F8B|nr:autoinducer binding domain-containing protein [Marinovum sp.]